MEFHEKLQTLRKAKGLTQEELARALFVSRAAVSKWEAGRGYPGIDSVRAIAKFFSQPLDSLLSADEALVIAEDGQEQAKKRLCDLVLGLLDISMLLLFFLPFFAKRVGNVTEAVSLLALSDVQTYSKVLLLVFAAAPVLMGIVMLALQGFRARVWQMIKLPLSLGVGLASLFLFIITNQPYAAAFSLALMAVKVIMIQSVSQR